MARRRNQELLKDTGTKWTLVVLGTFAVVGIGILVLRTGRK